MFERVESICSAMVFFALLGLNRVSSTLQGPSLWGSDSSLVWVFSGYVSLLRSNFIFGNSQHSSDVWVAVCRGRAQRDGWLVGCPKLILRIYMRKRVWEWYLNLFSDTNSLHTLVHHLLWILSWYRRVTKIESHLKVFYLLCEIIIVGI